MSPTDPQHPDHHVSAYERMLERVKALLDQSKEVGPTLTHALEQARDKAVELGELTREEAEKIGDYLRRDLEEAGRYLNDTGRELRDWARIDLLLAENRLFDLFSQVADQTKVELSRLALEAQVRGWHTGQVTMMGRLRCIRCGAEIELHETKRIPACPQCHGNDFQRLPTGT